MQAVIRADLQPGSWIAEGDLRRLSLDDRTGRLAVCVREADGLEHWYDLMPDAKCSLGAAERTQRELHADLVRMLEQAGERPSNTVPITVWLGCFPAGVWGCAAQPYDLGPSVKTWMN